MLRFIFERHQQDQNSGFEARDHYTMDVDLPQVEQELKRGGYGEMGFDHVRLIGVEILPPNGH